MKLKINRLDTDMFYAPWIFFITAWGLQYGTQNYIEDSGLLGEPTHFLSWVIFLIVCFPFFYALGQSYTISESGITMHYFFGLWEKHHLWKEFQYVTCLFGGEKDNKVGLYDINYYQLVIRKEKPRCKSLMYLRCFPEINLNCYPSLYLSLQVLCDHIDKPLPFLVTAPSKEYKPDLLKKWHFAVTVYVIVVSMMSIILMITELHVFVDCLFVAILGVPIIICPKDLRFVDAQEAEFQRFYDYIKNRDSITNS